MNIRKVNQNDFKELFELVMQNMKYHIKSNKLNWEPITKIRKAEMKELKKDFKNSKTKIFIAETNGKIIGYINFSIQGKNSYTKKRKVRLMIYLFWRSIGKKVLGNLLLMKHFLFLNQRT